MLLPSLPMGLAITVRSRAHQMHERDHQMRFHLINPDPETNRNPAVGEILETVHLEYLAS